MDCSTLGLPVHHHLPEFAQTHVHHVGGAIQSSHPLSSPLLPLSIFLSIRVFSNESVLRIRWPKYWNFSFNISPSNEYSRLISLEPRTMLDPQFQGGACGRQCQSTTELSSPLVGCSLRFMLQAESLHSLAGAGTQLPQWGCPTQLPHQHPRPV